MNPIVGAFKFRLLIFLKGKFHFCKYGNANKLTAFSFTNDADEIVYDNELIALQEVERNTIYINYNDVQRYSTLLSTAIELQLYKYVDFKHTNFTSQSAFCSRFYPYLINAVRDLAMEKCGENNDLQNSLKRKEIFIALKNVPTSCPLRQLTMHKLGMLTRVSGQVVRTHPVLPELARATFVCEDCGGTTSNVEQQFTYTLVCSLSFYFQTEHWHLF